MENDNELMELLKGVFDAEIMVETRNKEAKEAEFLLDGAKSNLRRALEKLDRYMKESGVVEAKVHGKISDYKISYTAPRGSVEIVDEQAVPDEFKTTQTVISIDKKAAGEFLKQAETAPNWGCIKYSEPKITYKALKRKVG